MSNLERRLDHLERRIGSVSERAPWFTQVRFDPDVADEYPDEYEAFQEGVKEALSESLLLFAPAGPSEPTDWPHPDGNDAAIDALIHE